MPHFDVRATVSRHYYERVEAADSVEAATKVAAKIRRGILEPIDDVEHGQAGITDISARRVRS